MGVTTHHGDAVRWAREYSGPLFHALLCDAPYEMDFMGREWDRSGVAFDPNTWEAFARVLYPGAFLFVFAGENIQEGYSTSSGRSQSRNPHPTVKPLTLTEYLATLLLPPALYAPRRLFVPFAGVGSEQIGAHLAGWEEIEGVELTEEYIPINEARVKYWQNKPRGAKKPKNKIPENVKDSGQKELF